MRIMKDIITKKHFNKAVKNARSVLICGSATATYIRITKKQAMELGKRFDSDKNWTDDWDNAYCLQHPDSDVIINI